MAAINTRFTLFSYSMTKWLAVFFMAVFSLLSLASCSNMAAEDHQQKNTMFSEFERKIAQKMSLDIRYFCADEAPERSQYCRKNVTKLPKELAQLIQDTDLGGVVLFAENLVSNQQIIQLTTDLQQAAMASKDAKPLIISIDQEGGRVARLPHATTFAGNMAIGATYHQHQAKYATITSGIIASELSALGINNNYAPVIDVNTNADNPVINTRSFGENPQHVAEQGAAVVNALQLKGIMATLKHFPGHGDTHVDSHLGLPRVDHDLATIEKTDLAPFKWAIEHSDPAMVMTAHIQYPALDSSTIKNKHGVDTIRPATMSRTILHDLLRKEMGFTGLIATDALDMAGVAHYFDEVTATVETFCAGADIAVMPFKVRVPADVDKFKKFVKAVSQQLQQKIANNQLHQGEIDNSVARINFYKYQYIKPITKSVNAQVAIADAVVASDEHLKVQQQLADDSTILLKNSDNLLPIKPLAIKHIHLLVATEQEQQALQRAIARHWQQAGQSKLTITSIIAEQDNPLARVQNISQLKQADLVIATVDIKIVSAVDLGGVDDLITQTVNSHKSGKVPYLTTQANYGQLLQLQLALAKAQGIKSVLIAQGSPFLIDPYLASADATLLNFDDRVMQDSQGNNFSAGMNTSIAIATGHQQAKGVLPVSL